MVRHQQSLCQETVDVQFLEAGKVEQGFEKSDLVESVLAHGRSLELDDL